MDRINNERAKVIAKLKRVGRNKRVSVSALMHAISDHAMQESQRTGMPAWNIYIIHRNVALMAIYRDVSGDTTTWGDIPINGLYEYSETSKTYLLV